MIFKNNVCGDLLGKFITYAINNNSVITVKALETVICHFKFKYVN